MYFSEPVPTPDDILNVKDGNIENFLQNDLLAVLQDQNKSSFDTD